MGPLSDRDEAPMTTARTSTHLALHARREYGNKRSISSCAAIIIGDHVGGAHLHRERAATVVVGPDDGEDFRKALAGPDLRT